MCIELKIKSKHLSVESKIIRFEENKLKQQLRSKKVPVDKIYPLETQLHSLTNHRKIDVRNENRATYLARAFLEGKPYKSVEQKRKPCNELIYRMYIVPRVVIMVCKYGRTKVEKDAILEWSKIDNAAVV